MLGSMATPAGSTRMRSSTPPARTMVPGSTIARSIFAPPTFTPLVDPTSRTSRPRSVRAISRWWRETVSSGSTSSFCFDFPTRSTAPGSPGTRAEMPFASPEITVTSAPSGEYAPPSAVRVASGSCA